MDLSFIKSTRWLKLLLAAICWGLLQAGILPETIATPLIGLLLADVAVRTIDRASEKLEK